MMLRFQRLSVNRQVHLGGDEKKVSYVNLVEMVQPVRTPVALDIHRFRNSGGITNGILIESHLQHALWCSIILAHTYIDTDGVQVYVS